MNSLVLLSRTDSENLLRLRLQWMRTQNVEAISVSTHVYRFSRIYAHRSPELYYSLQGRFERIYVQCNTIVSNVCARATAIFHRFPVESSNFGDIIRVSRCKTCDPNIVETHPSVDPMVNGLRSGSNRQYWSVCPSTHRYINRAVVAATHARGSSTIGIEKQK